MATDDARHRILTTAQRLFYQRGVRAVGVDLVIAEAGVAKATLYRHFPTKDELVAAFLEQEDREFWRTWDDVAGHHHGDPGAELAAQLDRIATRVSRDGYRGCPQLNVAAEFPDADHPARQVAARHKDELRSRLERIATGLGVADPVTLGGQLAVLVNGAFVSSSMFGPDEAAPLLRTACAALLDAARPSPPVAGRA